ncbi:MAG: M28 family peptidase [Anaerolineae bacterium]|jgi:hypothetical protein|nr:M28 family peptidase [Anaerolineae bacterium]
MTAPNLPEMRANAYGFTQDIITRFGPRLAGSKPDAMAAETIFETMRGLFDEARPHKFRMNPGAFLGWVRILVVLYVFCIVLVWLQYPGLSTLLLGTGLAIMTFEFFLYKEVVDPFFPKVTGTNVWGTIEPEGEVHQEVIISGHHDSAPIFNFFIHQPELYAFRVMGGIGTFALFFLYSLFLWIANPETMELWQTTLNGIFTFLLLLIVQLWFFAASKGTPGAGDNLVSVAAAIEVGKYFQQQKEEGNALQHTRVHIVSFDGEEAGLRGARAFFKANHAFFEERRTWMFNVDCPYYLKDIFFMTSDINTSVQLSQDMAERCVKIAHELGYPAVHKPITFLTGGTDAGEAAKYDIHATTLMAMPWDNNERAAVYHTPDDTIDKVEPQAVEAVIGIAIEFVQQVDKEN